MATWFTGGTISRTAANTVSGISTDWTNENVPVGSVLVVSGGSHKITARTGQVLTLADDWTGGTSTTSYGILTSPIATVPTVTALSSLVDSQTDLLIAGGYAVMGDGGGGTLYLDTSTQSSDGLGGITFPGPNVGGIYTRPVDGIIHSKWFGIKGSGASNDAVKMQNFIDEIVAISRSPPGTLAGKGYIGFIDAGTIDCGGATLYINDTGDMTGGNVLGASFRGAGRGGTVIKNAAISVGDIANVIAGNGLVASTVFLSSFDLDGYIDFWSPQAATVMDRIGVSNPMSALQRAYTSGSSPAIAGSKLDNALCNIYDALQFYMLAVTFQAGANGASPSTNAVQINDFTNMTWDGGGCLATAGAVDGGQIGLLQDSLGLPAGDNAHGGMLTLRSLHFEGQQQESIYLKSVNDVQLACDVRTHTSHDPAHASIQIGDRTGVTLNPPSAVTIRGCYGKSDTGDNTFLQASYADGLLIKENYIGSFLVPFAIGAGVNGYVVDPSNQFIGFAPTTTASGFALGGQAFSGSISTSAGVTTMSAVGSGLGAFKIGAEVSGAGVATGTLITGPVTSVTSILHTYPLNLAQTVPSTTLTAAPTSGTVSASFSGSAMTVTAPTSGTLAIGQTIAASGVPSGTFISGEASGIVGGYLLNSSVASPTAIEPVMAVTNPVIAFGSGFISGGALIIGAPTYGSVGSGQVVFNADIVGGTVVLSGPSGGGAGVYDVSVPQTLIPNPVPFVGVISGGPLTASTPAVGLLSSGQWLAASGISAGTEITAQTSGFAGSAGTYSVNINQTFVPSASASAMVANGQLTVGPPVSGGTLTKYIAGQFAIGAGLSSGTAIVSQISGIDGGEGIYAINNSTQVVSAGAVVTSSTIAGTVLSATTPLSGGIVATQLVTGSGVLPGTSITSQIDGTPSGAGRYRVNPAQTLASATTLAMLGSSLTIQGGSISATFGEALATYEPDASVSGSVSGSTLNVTSVLAGSVQTGQFVTGGGVAPGVTVEGPLNGGGYSVNTAQTVASGTRLIAVPTAAQALGSIGGATLSVASVTSGGYVDAGQLVIGAGIVTGTVITSAPPGGGTGSYTVSPSHTNGTRL